MNEDAGCDHPCGGEPMQCGSCPDRGSGVDIPVDLMPGEYVYTCFVCGFNGNHSHFNFNKEEQRIFCPNCKETEEIG